jgi:hypothetical protein
VCLVLVLVSRLPRTPISEGEIPGGVGIGGHSDCAKTADPMGGPERRPLAVLEPLAGPAADPVLAKVHRSQQSDHEPIGFLRALECALGLRQLT